MALVLRDEAERRCSQCIAIDFNELFDARQFDHLPPLQSPGTTPWTRYIRKIHTFGLESLQETRGYCSLCAFLWPVARLAAQLQGIPHLLSQRLGPTVKPVDETHTDLQDGEGFTLAATYSEYIYPTTCGRPAVWLVVLKGSNILKRIAFEYELKGHRNIPLDTLTSVALCVRSTGTWIAEADTNDIPDPKGPVRARLVHPSSVDYALLQSWLEACPSPSHSAVAVPHMKLIDCAARTIVAAEPHMRYLALSYVWGKGPPEPYQYPSLPATLPPTVDDALTATLGLGLRYVWIDRYCIWQDDPVHKSTQILHMTQIYGNAVATVAAAAGMDPTHGLPGVSANRPRTFGRQYVGRAGPRLLASGYIHNRHKEAVSSSVWDTRAWTFQEVTLSSRIFFFSDLQVSFLCDSYEAFEHLSQPITLARPGGGLFSNASTYLSGVAEPEGIRGLVWRYCSRAMTYSSDAFNAFAGVLGAWSMANKGCFHYWALPLIFPGDQCTDQELSEALWNALCWRLDSGTLRSGKRREDFPTWSWLSIESRVTVNIHGRDLERKRTGQDPEFAVETQGGTMVDWCDFIRAGGLRRSPLTWARKLRVHGLMFKVGPFEKATRGKQIMHFMSLKNLNSSLRKEKEDVVMLFQPDFGVDSPDRLFTEQFEAISAYTYRYADESHAIVFERVGDTGRRIGLLGLGMIRTEDMPYTVPGTVVCDPAEVFGAVRDSVCLE